MSNNAPVQFLVAFLDTRRKKTEEVTGEEILYLFPKLELTTELQRLLLLFIGLKDLSFQITGHQVTTATFNQEGTDKKLKISYVIFRECIFVVMLPMDLPDFLFRSITDDLFLFVSFVFGSIGSTDPSDPTRCSISANKGVRAALNKTFRKFFEDIFTYFDDEKMFYSTFTKGVCYYHAPTELQLKISEALSALEASNRELAEMLSEDSRVCLIIGGCVFSKGNLVCSHLDALNTKDVVRFLQRTGVLESRTEGSPEFETVQEVYSIVETTQTGEDLATVYHREKRLLSVLAQEQELICLLMIPKGESEGQLDPFYVDEMRLMFHKLRNEGIIPSLRRMMLIPQIAQKGVPLEAIERGKIVAAQEELPYKITFGEHNVLYQYMSYSAIHGVIISPIHKPSIDCKHIQEVFWRNCQRIRSVLLQKQKGSDKQQSVILEDNPKRQKKELPDEFKEFGVRVSNVEGVTAETFLIIGRLYKNLHGAEKEFYVCYSDSIPQSTVEMAFKLHFGMFSF